MDYNAKLNYMQKYIPFLEHLISIDGNNFNGTTSKRLLKHLNNYSPRNSGLNSLDKIEVLIRKIYSKCNMKTFKNIFEVPMEIVQISSSDSESDDQIKFRRVRNRNSTKKDIDVIPKNEFEEDSLFIRRSTFERKNHKPDTISTSHSNSRTGKIFSKDTPTDIIEISESEEESLNPNNNESKFKNKNMENLEQECKSSELQVLREIAPEENMRDPRLRSRHDRRSIYSRLEDKNITEDVNMEHQNQTTTQIATNIEKNNLKLNTSAAAKIQNRRKTISGLSREAISLMQYTENCFDGQDIKNISETGRKRRNSIYKYSNEQSTGVRNSNDLNNKIKSIGYPQVKKFKTNTAAKIVRRKSCSEINEKRRWSILQIPEPKKLEIHRASSTDSDNSDNKMKIKPLILSRRKNIIVSDEDEDYETDDFRAHRRKKVFTKSCKVRVSRLKISKLSEENRTLFEQLKKSYELLNSEPPSLEIFKQISVPENNIPKRVKRNCFQNIDKKMCFSNIAYEKCFICNKKVRHNLVNHYVCNHPESEVLISRIEVSLIKEIEETPIIGTAKDVFNKKFNVKCIFCNENIIESIIKLHEHYASHTGEFAYECDGCYMKSPYEKDLINHVKLNSCKSAKKIQLYAYEKNIDRIFAYLCKECNFIQLNKANIEQHLIHEHDIACKDSRLIKRLQICKLENYKESRVPEEDHVLIEQNSIKIEHNYDTCNESNLVNSAPEQVAKVSNYTLEDLNELTNLLENGVINESDNDSETTVIFNLQEEARENNINKNKVINSLQEAKKCSHKKENVQLGSDETKLRSTNHNVPKLITLEQRYKCSAKKCSYMTTTEDLLEEHFLRIHRKLEKYKCYFCAFAIEHIINDFKLIKNHLRMHSESIYVCGKCNHTSHCRIDLTKHMREEHKMEMSFTHIKRQINEKNELISNFTAYFENNETKLDFDFCPICFKSLNEKYDVLNHIKMEHDCLVSYQCGYCKQDCQNVQVIENHNIQKHRGKSTSIFSVFRNIENYSDAENSICMKLSKTVKPVTSQPAKKCKNKNVTQVLKKSKKSHQSWKIKLPKKGDYRKSKSANLNPNFFVDDQPVIIELSAAECNSTFINKVSLLKINETMPSLSPKKSCTISQIPYNKETTDASLMPNVLEEPNNSSPNHNLNADSELNNTSQNQIQTASSYNNLLSNNVLNEMQHNLVTTTTESVEFQDINQVTSVDNITSHLLESISSKIRNNNLGSTFHNNKDSSCHSNKDNNKETMISSTTTNSNYRNNAESNVVKSTDECTQSLQLPQLATDSVNIPNTDAPVTETLNIRTGVKLVPIQKLLQPKPIQTTNEIINKTTVIKHTNQGKSVPSNVNINAVINRQIFKPNNNNLELNQYSNNVLLNHPVETINRTRFECDQICNPNYSTRNLSNNIILIDNESYKGGNRQYTGAESYSANGNENNAILPNTHQIIRNDIGRPTALQPNENQITNHAVPSQSMNTNRNIYCYQRFLFLCPHCNFRELNIELLIAHWKNQHYTRKPFEFMVKKIFYCPHCNFAGCINELWSHYNLDHGSSVFAISDQLKNRCGLCKFEFAFLYQLEAHFENTHSLNCDLCKFTSCNVRHLIAHCKNVHKLNSTNPSNYLFKNSSCIEESSMFSYLLEIGLNSLRFECNYCKNGFLTEKECKDHIEVIHCVQANAANLYTIKELNDVHIGCRQCHIFFYLCDSNLERVFQHCFETHSPRNFESYFQIIHYIFPKGLLINLHDIRNLKNFFFKNKYLSIIKNIESKK